MGQNEQCFMQYINLSYKCIIIQARQIKNDYVFKIRDSESQIHSHRLILL